MLQNLLSFSVDAGRVVLTPTDASVTDGATEVCVRCSVVVLGVTVVLLGVTVSVTLESSSADVV